MNSIHHWLPEEIWSGCCPNHTLPRDPPWLKKGHGRYNNIIKVYICPWVCFRKVLECWKFTLFLPTTQLIRVQLFKGTLSRDWFGFWGHSWSVLGLNRGTQNVFLAVNASLRWLNNFSGVYFIQVSLLLIGLQGLGHFFRYRPLLSIGCRIEHILRLFRKKTTNTAPTTTNKHQSNALLSMNNYTPIVQWARKAYAARKVYAATVV